MDTLKVKDNFENEMGSQARLQGVEEEDLSLRDKEKLPALERLGTSGKVRVNGCFSYEQTVVMSSTGSICTYRYKNLSIMNVIFKMFNLHVDVKQHVWVPVKQWILLLWPNIFIYTTYSVHVCGTIKMYLGNAFLHVGGFSLQFVNFLNLKLFFTTY